MKRVLVTVLLVFMFAGSAYAEPRDRAVLGLEPIVVVGITETTTAVEVGGVLSASVMLSDRLGVYGATSASLMQHGSKEQTIRSTTLSLDVGGLLVPFVGATWFSVRGSLLNGLQHRSEAWAYSPGIAADLVTTLSLGDRLRFVARGGLGYRFGGELGVLPRFGTGLGLSL